MDLRRVRPAAAIVWPMSRLAAVLACRAVVVPSCRPDELGTDVIKRNGRRRPRHQFDEPKRLGVNLQACKLYPINPNFLQLCIDDKACTVRGAVDCRDGIQEGRKHGSSHASPDFVSGAQFQEPLLLTPRCPSERMERAGLGGPHQLGLLAIPPIPGTGWRSAYAK